MNPSRTTLFDRMYAIEYEVYAKLLGFPNAWGTYCQHICITRSMAAVTAAPLGYNFEAFTPVES